MQKVVKLPKSEQIVDVIKKIKGLKGIEVVFEIPTGSLLFKNPHNFSLIKKSAAAMGKRVIIITDDMNGRNLVAKAGLLLDEGDDRPAEIPVRTRTKVKKVQFGDIGASTMPRAAAGPSVSHAIRPPNLGRNFTASAGPSAIQMPSMPSLPRVRIPGISNNFTRYFILGMVVLVLLVFGAAVLLPQAQVTVYARSEPVTRDMEISVDKSIRSVNSSTLTVPGASITREISHTKNFPVTGVKLAGTAASGSLQLYNFTKNILTLRTATTTLKVDGKSYSLTKDVTGLRPTARIGQGTDAEIDQSSLIPPVQIVAQEPGANHNAGANVRMEVVNQALGQADVYGMTSAALTGGASTETKVLSQEDIDKATAAMQAELPSLAESELAEADGNSSIKVLPNAVTSEVLAKTANREVGDQAENFDMTIIARISGLTFNQLDVKSLVVEKINSVLSDDKYLLEDGEEVLTTSFKSVNIESGVGILAVQYQTTAAYKVENTNLSRILAGKSAVEIKEILLTKPEIDRVDVQFSPFFVNRAPRFNGKVYIQTVQSE